MFESIKAAAHTRRGEVLLDLGQYEGALAAYDCSIDLQPDDHKAHLARARVLGVLGRSEDALTALMRALDISPLSESTHMMYDVLPYLSQEQSLTAFDCALERRPDDLFANFQRAKLLYALDRYMDAFKALSHHIEVSPGYAPSYFLRGKILHENMMYDEALSEYLRTMQDGYFGVDYAETMSAIGETLFALGRDEESLEACDRSLRVRPHDAATNERRGWALLRLGRIEDALAASSRLLELQPSNTDLLEWLSYKLHETGRYQEAVAAFARLLELRPDHYLVSRFRELRDIAQFGIGPNELGEDVLDAIEGILDQRPNDAVAHRIRGRALWLRTNREEEALASLDRSLQLQQDCETYIIRGRVLEKLGRIEEALASFDHALILQEDPEAHSQRGLVLRSLGRNAEALVAFDASLAMRPDDSMTSLMRGKTARALENDSNEGEDAPESFSGVDIS